MLAQFTMYRTICKCSCFNVIFSKIVLCRSGDVLWEGNFVKRAACFGGGGGLVDIFINTSTESMKGMTIFTICYAGYFLC